MASPLMSVSSGNIGTVFIHSFINNAHVFSTETLGAVTPMSLKHVPIRILKTATGNRLPACVASLLKDCPDNTPRPSMNPTPPSLLKEGPDNTPRPSMNPTPHTKQQQQFQKKGRRWAPQFPPMEDEEKLFGRYVAAVMKKLSNRFKAMVKMQIQQILSK